MHANEDAWFVDGYLLEALRLPEDEVLVSSQLEPGAAIATDRSVGDADALTVMQGFYAQADWQADPARALARVQQALDAQPWPEGAANPQSWAAFSVLGRSPEVHTQVVAQ